MFGGAKKVACPSCGAKNKPGERRCRVCTTIIDAGAEEQGGFQGPGGTPASSTPAPDSGSSWTDESFAAPPAFGEAPSADGPTADEPTGGGTGGFDGIVIEAPPRNPDVAPPPLLNDEEWDPNWLDSQRD